MDDLGLDEEALSLRGELAPEALADPEGTSTAAPRCWQGSAGRKGGAADGAGAEMAPVPGLC